MGRKIKSITANIFDKSDESNFYKSAYTEFDESGNILESTTWHNDESLELKTVTTYDSSGRKLEEINYTEEGEESDRSVFHRDSNGEITKVEIHYPDGSKTVKSYDYNKFEQTLQIKITDEEGEFEGEEFYKFNASNHIIERKVKSFSGHIEQWELSEYSDKGKLLSQIEKDENENVTVRKEFIYDENDNLLRLNIISAKGNLIDCVLTKYDENGRITEQNVKSAYLTKYFYDDENLTKKEERYNKSDLQIYECVSKFDNDGNVLEEEEIGTVTRYNYEFF